MVRMTHIGDKKENGSTRSVMIKLAAKMCKPYPEPYKELMLGLGLPRLNQPPRLYSLSSRCSIRRADKEEWLLPIT